MLSQLRSIEEFEESRFFVASPTNKVTNGLVMKFFGLTSFVFDKLANGKAARADVYCVRTQLTGGNVPPHYAALYVPRDLLMPGTSDPDGVTPEVATYTLQNTRVKIVGKGPGALEVNMGPAKPECPKDPSKPRTAGLSYFMAPQDGVFPNTKLLSGAELSGVSDAVVELTEGRVEHQDDVDFKDKYDRPIVVDVGGKEHVLRQVMYYGLPGADTVRIELHALRAGGPATRYIFIDTSRSPVIAGVCYLPVTEANAKPDMKLDDIQSLTVMLDPKKDGTLPIFKKFCSGFVTPLCGCCPPGRFAR
jgi:hypothetical protein